MYSEEKEQEYQSLILKRNKTARRSANEETRRKYHRVSRLRLEDALKQVRNSKNLEKATEGWSEARKRAYRQIDTNPNSYFYRFNAPGDVQRTGNWTKVI